MVWIQIVIALVMAVVGELLRPKPKFNNPEPSALGDFSFPTVDPSRVIPIFWGTCKMSGPNCTWFGDLEVVTLKKKVKTGWFSSKRITTGFNYYLGVQLVYAYGECDEFIELRADDKTLNVSTKVFTGDVCEFDIDSPTVLSTDDPPSGVKGHARLYKGTFGQPANLYLGAQWNESEVSAFRPLIHLVLEKCYLGNTETPPPITLIARRCPNPLGLAGGKHNVNGDANIACAAYELMTNTLWGMKVPPSKLDIDSFIESGNTLAAEGLGISMLVQNATSGRDLLAEILRHADGVIYADPVTGLYTMALARADYLDYIEDLPVIDNSNILPDTFEFTRLSWESTKNTIIVNYTDREAFQTTPVQYQDLANIDVRGGVIDAEEINFLGFSNPQAALNAAARACKTRSSPLMSAQFSIDRTGYQLRPGSVFVLNRPQDHLDQVIMRVLEISYGTLDDMQIKIKAMEDVFAVGFIAYKVPTPSDWTNPVGPPSPLTRQYAVELPYEFTGEPGALIGTLASRSGGIDAGYLIHTSPDNTLANYVETGRTTDFTPSGLLTAEYPSTTPARDPVGFSVESVMHALEIESVTEDVMLMGDSIALIRSAAGDEFVAFKTFSDPVAGVHNVVDVIRGVYGTTPLTHPAGSQVWFLSGGFGLASDAPYAGSFPMTKWLRYRPYNTSATLPLSSATGFSIVLTNRALRPYAPRYVRINNVVNPATISGDATLTWEYVNPELRGGRISAAGDGSDPVTPGTTFTVKVYINNILKRTVTGLTEPTYTYTVADRLTDNSNGSYQTRFGVLAVRGVYSSAEAATTNALMSDANVGITITTATPLPGATSGVGYSVTMAASGGAGAPYTWDRTSGAFPPGIDLTPEGVLSGVSTTPGVYNFTLRAQSPVGTAGTKSFSLTVT